MDERSRQTLFSSATDEWSTPDDFFAALNDEFHFTLDVAADTQNAKVSRLPVGFMEDGTLAYMDQRTLQCVRGDTPAAKGYYTQQDDGLALPWVGTVWCNPPYGRTIGAWAAKAREEAHLWRQATVVMLLPARTGARWFTDHARHADELRFVQGRLKFGGSENSAPFDSVVVIFRKRPITIALVDDDRRRVSWIDRQGVPLYGER